MKYLVVLTLSLLLRPWCALGFLPSSRSSASVGQRESTLFAMEDFPLVGEECGGVSEDSSFIFESLRKRKKEIENGIGKRYICRTQKGFLNVHKEPCEPFNPYNIVNQLTEGDVVTSIGPPRGGWIHHDSGWSIAIYNGHTWLEELKE